MIPIMMTSTIAHMSMVDEEGNGWLLMNVLLRKIVNPSMNTTMVRAIGILKDSLMKCSIIIQPDKKLPPYQIIILL